MKPLELLNKHCTFNNPYEVYVILGVSRKKENNCTNSQEKVFREIIKRPSCIEKKFNRLRNSVLAYRDSDGSKRNFYTYVSVNARDTRKAFFQLQKQMLGMSEELSKGVDVSNNLNRINRYWLSVLMKPISRAGRGKFVVDIDIKDERKELIVEQLKKETEIILEQETKNGYHVVIMPFNKNSPTMNMMRDRVNNYESENSVYEIKTDALLFVEAIGK